MLLTELREHKKNIYIKNKKATDKLLVNDVKYDYDMKNVHKKVTYLLNLKMYTKFFFLIGGIGKEHITKLLPWSANP